MTSHHYMYGITPSTFMKWYPIYVMSHVLLSWQHNDHTWHLTHYIWHHRHCICIITQMTHTSVSMYRSFDDITTRMEIITLVTCMTSYTLYMTSHSHFMKSRISIHDITTTAFMTSDFLYMTSHPRFRISYPLYLWHQSQYILRSHPLWFWIHIHYIWRQTQHIQYNQYIWHHTLHICICVITCQWYNTQCM